MTTLLLAPTMSPHLVYGHQCLCYLCCLHSAVGPFSVGGFSSPLRIVVNVCFFCSPRLNIHRFDGLVTAWPVACSADVNRRRFHSTFLPQSIPLREPSVAPLFSANYGRFGWLSHQVQRGPLFLLSSLCQDLAFTGCLFYIRMFLTRRTYCTRSGSYSFCSTQLLTRCPLHRAASPPPPNVPMRSFLSSSNSLPSFVWYLLISTVLRCCFADPPCVSSFVSYLLALVSVLSLLAVPTMAI